MVFSGKSVKWNSISKWSDLTLSLFFGLLSAVFSLIQFRIPNLDNAYSDLREIPLLICLLYLRNPLYIILICLLSPVFFIGNGPYLATFIMHILPLLVGWWIARYGKPYELDNLRFGLLWFVFTLFYYYVLMFPSFILSNKMLGEMNEPAVMIYRFLATSSIYEVTASALIVTLYTIQFAIRKSLELTNQNLEKIVMNRTEELTAANNELQTLNEELKSSNEEIKSLNDNLEKIVANRTEKIRQQLEKLNRYAFMNSHEVRGPVARILGLVMLMQKEKDPTEVHMIVEKLDITSRELDEVVRKMNALLDEEISG